MVWLPSCSGCGRGSSRARLQCGICLPGSPVSQGLVQCFSQWAVKGSALSGKRWWGESTWGTSGCWKKWFFLIHVCWGADAGQELVTCSSCKAPRWHLSCQWRAGHTNLKVSCGRAPRRRWLPTTALGKVCVPTSGTQGSRDTELVGLPGPHSPGWAGNGSRGEMWAGQALLGAWGWELEGVG